MFFFLISIVEEQIHSSFRSFQLYKDCVAREIWARLVFETSGGREEYSLFCSPQPREAATTSATTAAATAAATTAAATAAATTAAATAAAATAAAVGSHRLVKKKRRHPNQRQREQARRRRETWIERRNCNSTISRYNSSSYSSIRRHECSSSSCRKVRSS